MEQNEQTAEKHLSDTNMSETTISSNVCSSKLHCLMTNDSVTEKVRHVCKQKTYTI